MKALVSIVMGSVSDLPVMKKAAGVFEAFEVPFEMHALSAHRTPTEVEAFARNAQPRGIRVIVAAAGMAAHLPGVIAAMTPLPVIGVPLAASMEGVDALLSIVQMPPGVPVATVGIDGSMNAALLAIQILSVRDEALQAKFALYKENLKTKIAQANQDLSSVKYNFKTN
jgi:5-(carboxyamino)imidazole ribonucleotide mutase